MVFIFVISSRKANLILKNFSWELFFCRPLLFIPEQFGANISFYKVDVTFSLTLFFIISLTSVSFDRCERVVVCFVTRSGPSNKLIQLSRVSEIRENYDLSFFIGKFCCIWKLVCTRCVFHAKRNKHFQCIPYW